MGRPAMALIASFPVHARFVFLLMPRLVTGRCTPRRLAGYAIELTSNGSRRLGRWCWNRAIRGSLHDEPMSDALFELCVRAGDFDAAAALANSFYDTSGLNPATAARHTGGLILGGAYSAAVTIYDRLLEHCGYEVVNRSPAPAWDEAFDARSLRAQLAARAANSADDHADTSRLELDFAKLCFSFSAFDASARLFERAAKSRPLDARERTAHAYALLRCGRVNGIPPDIETVNGTYANLVDDADWQMLIASVLFARGAVPAATEAVEETLRSRFHDHPDLEQIVGDCRRMVTCIAQVPPTIECGGDSADTAPGAAPALRKIFVCGNGWSGSGALYDALTEYEGINEMPHAPADDYLNDCTANEMMFVQGPAGLGRIWRTARTKGTVSRYDLWELFRCHVSGAGAIGYAEHKSARAATHLMTLNGSLYTSAFLRLFDHIAALPASAPRARLRTVLAETTEALTGTLADAKGGACVVFNNAVFGPNLDMLAIFRNFKAAVVVRDPVDTYADRRAQDLKHWMTPASFIAFYRSSREAFQARKNELPAEDAVAVREVEFERLVVDESYRKDIIDWLLDGQIGRRIRERFEPERSAKNVGINERLLSDCERRVIERYLGKWRRRG
jgi:hypothetical protein